MGKRPHSRTYKYDEGSYFLSLSYMLSKISEYYHSGMSAVIVNPKYYLLASAVEMIIMLLVIYKWSPLGISKSHPSLSAIFVISFLFVQLAMYFFVKNKSVLASKGIEVTPDASEVLIKIVFTLLTVFGSVLVAYGTIWGIAQIPSLNAAFDILMNVSMLIVALAVAYVIMKPVVDAAKTGDGRSSLLTLLGQFIMYVPCLVVDLVDWLRLQYAITTKPVWILLGLEILLVALNILIPKLAAWLIKKDGRHLLQGPTYIDKQTLIKHESIHQDQENPTREYHYSISAWFWINPQPPNTGMAYTKYTNILEYGSQPAVQYNSLERSLRVLCEIKPGKDAEIFETTDVPLQRWNNIVINYDAGTMDVFLNGELVASKPGVAPYMSFENMILGSKDGIQGSVANVVFYDKILYPSQIRMSYNALRLLPSPGL
jgi:hypothetical protein